MDPHLEELNNFISIIKFEKPKFSNEIQNSLDSLPSSIKNDSFKTWVTLYGDFKRFSGIGRRILTRLKYKVIISAVNSHNPALENLEFFLTNWEKLGIENMSKIQDNLKKRLKALNIDEQKMPASIWDALVSVSSEIHEIDKSIPFEFVLIAVEIKRGYIEGIDYIEKDFQEQRAFHMEVVSKKTSNQLYIILVIIAAGVLLSILAFLGIL